MHSYLSNSLTLKSLRKPTKKNSSTSIVPEIFPSKSKQIYSGIVDVDRISKLNLELVKVQLGSIRGQHQSQMKDRSF